jgi:hypothetical protein
MNVNFVDFGMCIYFTAKRRCFKLFMACYNGLSIFGVRVMCWGGMDMKQIRPFTIALFMILWLAACVREDEGVGETAVAPYLNLIQQFPTSPWSWLAWARLEPMPSD